MPITAVFAANLGKAQVITRLAASGHVVEGGAIVRWPV